MSFARLKYITVTSTLNTYAKCFIEKFIVIPKWNYEELS